MSYVREGSTKGTKHVSLCVLAPLRCVAKVVAPSRAAMAVTDSDSRSTGVVKGVLNDRALTVTEHCRGCLVAGRARLQRQDTPTRHHTTGAPVAMTFAPVASEDASGVAMFRTLRPRPSLIFCIGFGLVWAGIYTPPPTTAPPQAGPHPPSSRPSLHRQHQQQQQREEQQRRRPAGAAKQGTGRWRLRRVKRGKVCSCGRRQPSHLPHHPHLPACFP